MAKENGKKGKVNVGAVIILIISALVFIPVGSVSIAQLISSRKEEANTPVFGKYDGKKIAWEAGSDFAQKVSNYAEMYQRAGIDINTNTNIRDYIFQQAYQETVESYAYAERVKKTGYTVSKRAVDHELINAFLNTDGNFDQEAYNSADKAKLASARESIEKGLIANRYTDDLNGSFTKVNGESLYGSKISSKELDFISKMGAEKHSFDLVQWSTTDLPEEEVLAYGKDNADKFTKYDLSALTFDSRDTAVNTLKQLKSNEITFEDAVSRSSQIYIDSLGKLTSNYAYAIENEILVSKEDAAAVKALEKDQLSEVIETKQPYSTSSSYSIFRGDGPAKAADFNITLDAAPASEEESSVPEILKVVRTYLTSYESGYIENYFINKANKFLTDAKVSSFDEAAVSANVEKKEIPAFPVNYGNSAFFDVTPSEGALSGASRDEAVLKQIFALDVDQVSEPIVIGSYIAVLKCTGIQIEDLANIDQSSYSSTILSNDQLSMRTNLDKDPKHENNFWSTYIKYVGMPASFSSVQ